MVPEQVLQLRFLDSALELQDLHGVRSGVGALAQDETKTEQVQSFFWRPRSSWNETRSSSARWAQQSGFCSESFVLLNVVLLEAHGDPLGHLQVLLQAGLRAAGLEPHEQQQNRIM